MAFLFKNNSDYEGDDWSEELDHHPPMSEKEWEKYVLKEMASNWGEGIVYGELNDDATVYVNEQIFKNNVQIQRVEEYYRDKFNCQNIRILKVSADYFTKNSISIYSKSDRFFAKRGYIAEGEINQFDRGEDGDNVYLLRNKAAACQQFQIVSALVSEPEFEFVFDGQTVKPETLLGQISKDIRVPLFKQDGLYFPIEKIGLLIAKTNEETGAVSGLVKDAVKETKEKIRAVKRPIGDLVDDVMAQFIKTIKDKYRGASIDQFVTDFKELLIDRKYREIEVQLTPKFIAEFSNERFRYSYSEAMKKRPIGQKIHDAYCACIKNAKSIFDKDSFGLITETSSAIAEQIKWEAINCGQLFEGASKGGLVLWQTQALAYLRKAAYQIEFYQNAQFNKKQIEANEAASFNREQLRASKETTVNFDPSSRMLSLSNPQSPKMTGEPPELLETVELPHIKTIDELRRLEWGSLCESLSFVSLRENWLSCDELRVATLHASTYNDDYSFDKYESENWEAKSFRPFVSWIGNLKRLRQAVLTKKIAEKFETVWKIGQEFDPEYDYSDFDDACWTHDRFGTAARKAIREACERLMDLPDGASIDIVYEWTRNSKTPWAGEWVGDVLKITGPLLDFPISQAEYWNKAAIDLAAAKD